MYPLLDEMLAKSAPGLEDQVLCPFLYDMDQKESYLQQHTFVDIDMKERFEKSKEVMDKINAYNPATYFESPLCWTVSCISSVVGSVFLAPMSSLVLAGLIDVAVSGATAVGVKRLKDYYFTQYKLLDPERTVRLRDKVEAINDELLGRGDTRETRQLKCAKNFFERKLRQYSDSTAIPDF